MRIGARFAKWGLGLFLFGVLALLGVFAVGYPGYFVFDAIRPGYCYSPITVGKNAWLPDRRSSLQSTSPERSRCSTTSGTRSTRFR